MHVLKFALTVLGVLGLTMGTAHAYLDPGTISTLLHSVLASLVALGIALKLYWHRLLRFLGLRRKSTHTGGKSETDAAGGSVDADDGRSSG